MVFKVESKLIKLHHFTMIVLFMMLTALSPFAQSAYFVDPVRGNDEYTGRTPRLAFKTIRRAKDVLRNVSAQMARDINVYLRGGTHFFGRTVGVFIYRWRKAWTFNNLPPIQMRKADCVWRGSRNRVGTSRRVKKTSIRRHLTSQQRRGSYL